MQYSIPENFRLVYTPEQIAARTAELGAEISVWASAVQQSTGMQPLAVCILRGAIFFFSDLLRSLQHTVEPTFCRTWSYSSETNQQLSGGAVRVNVSDVVAEGRPLLLVDDICDSGSTLSKLEKVLLDLGASEVRSAVLIHRQVDNPKYVPTWTAFEHEGEEWFVGYGMEDKNCYSNLPGVYIIS